MGGVGHSPTVKMRSVLGGLYGLDGLHGHFIDDSCHTLPYCVTPAMAVCVLLGASPLHLGNHCTWPVISPLRNPWPAAKLSCQPLPDQEPTTRFLEFLHGVERWIYFFAMCLCSCVGVLMGTILWGTLSLWGHLSERVFLKSTE